MQDYQGSRTDTPAYAETQLPFMKTAKLMKRTPLKSRKMDMTRLHSPHSPNGMHGETRVRGETDRSPGPAHRAPGLHLWCRNLVKRTKGDVLPTTSFPNVIPAKAGECVLVLC